MIKRFLKRLKFRSIHNIEIGRGTRGWSCELYVTIQTHQQFSSEWHTISDWHPRFWLAIIKTFRKYYQTKRQLQSVVGPYNNTLYKK